MSTEAGGDRFRDPRSDLWDYMDEILVCCPRCGNRARVASNPTVAPKDRPTFTLRRLTCLTCNYSTDQAAPSATNYDREGRDPYFGLELWLSTHCAGHVLWAYNEAHLALLKDFVSGRLRERSWPQVGDRTSLVERLPSWMKQAKHREALIRSLDRLRLTLD